MELLQVALSLPVLKTAGSTVWIGLSSLRSFEIDEIAISFPFRVRYLCSLERFPPLQNG
jgi:hypothetical protein